EAPPLEPEAIAYRTLLNELSGSPPWVVGAAVLAIFVEGSVHERAELAGTRVQPSIDEAVAQHPMVLHYGCPPEKLRLARAHRAVEGGHRLDAWRMVIEHATEPEVMAAVVQHVETAHAAWLRYRDGVARAMRLDRAVVAES